MDSLLVFAIVSGIVSPVSMFRMIHAKNGSTGPLKVSADFLMAVSLSD